VVLDHRASSVLLPLALCFRVCNVAYSLTFLPGLWVMALLDEIIGAAVDDKVAIGSLLRKCLILAHQVKNDKFTVWLKK
jgi:hypothetical protein